MKKAQKVCMYASTDNLLCSMPLQAGSVAFDVGGWDTYGDHWRYFFECMLAPVARQASAALERLPVSATPRSNMDKPSQFLNSVLEVGEEGGGCPVG
jgi:hypothetical protein